MLGWVGYRSPERRLLFPALAAGVAAWSTQSVLGFDVGAMLEAGAVAASVVMAFGISYAATGWAQRRERYGSDSEVEVGALVGTYYVAAVAAVAANVLLSGWPTTQPPVSWSVRLLDGTPVSGPVTTVQMIGTIAVFYLLFGAIPVAVSLISPPPIPLPVTPRPGPVGSRVGARIVDTVVGGGLLAYVAYYRIPLWLDGLCLPRTDICLPWATVRWGLVIVPPVAVFVYELWPLLTGTQMIGKRCFRVCVESVPAVRGRILRSILRALILSACSPVAPLAWLFASGTVPHWYAAAVVLVPVLGLSILLHVQRRGLHDLICGTRVIRTPEQHESHNVDHRWASVL